MATFVLVHGSMHGGWCWRRVVPLLRAAGHEVFAPTLTGLGERAHLARPDVDLETHVRDVLGVLAYEDLAGVVLIGHSYATLVCAGVADRAPDRIAHLVSLDGPAGDDGRALLDYYPADARAARHDRVAAEGDGWRLLPPADPAALGAALGIGSPEDVAWVHAKLVPQPFKTMTQPLRLARPAGFAGPKTYIACVDAGQDGWREAMIERARTEPGWRYRELATGHDAMIAAPRDLADLLLEAARPPGRRADGPGVAGSDRGPVPALPGLTANTCQGCRLSRI